MDQNLSHNTEFLQFCDGTTEFFLPFRMQIFLKMIDRNSVNTNRLTESITYFTAKQKAFIGFLIRIIHAPNQLNCGFQLKNMRTGGFLPSLITPTASDSRVRDGMKLCGCHGEEAY